MSTTRTGTMSLASALMLTLQVTVAHAESPEPPDALDLTTEVGLRGRWQAGNLSQLSLMPSARIAASSSWFYGESSVNYHLLKVGDATPVDDLWVNALYQHLPENRFFVSAHVRGGFAASYRIEHSLLAGPGVGVNLFRESPMHYAQFHLLGGFLDFAFQGEEVVMAPGAGALFRARMPLTDTVGVSANVASYMSAVDPGMWGAATQIQLEMRLSGGLFATVQHRFHYNHRDVQNLEKYNSELLFGAQFRFSTRDETR